MANIFGRQVVLPLTNKSGGGVIAGDVVVVDTTNNDAFTTSTAGAFTGLIGVAQETIASNATGRVLTAGYAALVNVNASVTRGNFGKSYTVAKQATDAGASRIAGTFCQFLKGGTTPDAHLFGLADNTSGAGTGTVTTVEEVDGSPTDSAVTKIVFPNGTLGIASHVATYTPVAAAPDDYEVRLTAADVTFTNSNTAYDILTLSLPAGVWDLFGKAGLTSGNTNQTQLTLALFDGTSIVDDAQVVQQSGVGGVSQSASVSARVTLGSTTTVKLQGFSVRGSSDSKAVKTNTSNGTTNKATVLRAVKVTAAN